MYILVHTSTYQDIKIVIVCTSTYKYILVHTSGPHSTILLTLCVGLFEIPLGLFAGLVGQKSLRRHTCMYLSITSTYLYVQVYTKLALFIPCYSIWWYKILDQWQGVVHTVLYKYAVKHPRARSFVLRRQRCHDSKKIVIYCHMLVYRLVQTCIYCFFPRICRFS